MKLFKISIGHVETYAAGEDAEDVFARKAEYDPTFDYLPVVIEEVTLEGYEIIVKEIALKQGIREPSHIVHTLDRDGLKSWLTEHDVEFVPQWGEAKLRELAIANT